MLMERGNASNVKKKKKLFCSLCSGFVAEIQFLN